MAEVLVPPTSSRTLSELIADFPTTGSRSRCGRKQGQYKIINGLGVLQRLVEFDREWFNGKRSVGITKPGGVGSQSIGGIRQFAEFGINSTREINQHFDVVGLLVGFAVINEERLDCLLRRLLAVLNGDVVKRRFARRSVAGGFQVAPRFDHPCLRFGSGRVSHRASARDSRLCFRARS